MRSLISAAIAVTCVCMSVPAYAAPHIGGQSMAHAAHVGGARHVERAVHVEGARHGEREARRHFGHHRDGTSLFPFDFFDDSAAGPEAIGALPEPLIADPAPLAPSTDPADRPPCRETGAGGVVVLRGLGCTR